MPESSILRVVMDNKFYAHSVEGKPKSEWHRLEEHLTPPQSSPCQGEVGGVMQPSSGMNSAPGNGEDLRGQDFRVFVIMIQPFTVTSTVTVTRLE